MGLPKDRGVDLGPGNPLHYYNLRKYIETHYPYPTVVGYYSTAENVLPDIKGNLSAGYPVLVHLYDYETYDWDHVVVAIGYNETGLFYNDPSKSSSGSLVRRGPIKAYTSFEVIEPLLYHGYFGPLGTINTETLLVVKGTSPSPLGGTLDISSYGWDVMGREEEEYCPLRCNIYFEDIPSYSYLDLGPRTTLDSGSHIHAQGLSWKTVSKTGRGATDCSRISYKHNLVYKAIVNNHMLADKKYEVITKIVGKDGVTYYKLSKAKSVGRCFWGETEKETIVLQNALKETQYYQIQMQLLDSENNVIDYLSSPWIYYLYRGTEMRLRETSYHLYLHVHDREGNHVGLNYTTNQTELDIPGSYYHDNGNGTIIIVVPQIINLTIVVDARYTEDPVESYNLTVTLTTDLGVFSETHSGNITVGKSQTFTTEVSETGLELYVWQYIFKDSKRGTELRINVDDKYFQFIAPSKTFSVKYDANMRVREYRCFTSITICYEDDEMRLSAYALDGRFDFCLAYAKDRQTGNGYLLIDKLEIE